MSTLDNFKTKLLQRGDKMRLVSIHSQRVEDSHPFIHLEMAGMQRGISQHALLNVRMESCFAVKHLREKEEKKTGSAAGGYLEPASGTQQSTLHSRSSRTLRLGSGADTRPRFPARGGRRGGTGSRSDIDLLTGRPGIFPGTETLALQRHLSVINAPSNEDGASPSPCTCPHTCPQTCSG